jgi:hypothetical protein
MAALVGTPSDEFPEILATGRTDITTIFLSMSARHPEGRDGEYIEWHGLDHEPEQHRLPALRASRRIVSTPACRSARAATSERYDAVDHVMTYLFSDVASLRDFDVLNLAMTDAGRNPYSHGRPIDMPIPGMPLLERGPYHLRGIAAAPRVKIGADVLPWWPARGVYILIEQGESEAAGLASVPGVAGAWWASGIPMEPPYATGDIAGVQVTYCFLDGEPVETGKQLQPVLQRRWADSEVTPLLAAPFHCIVPYEWNRYLP